MGRAAKIGLAGAGGLAALVVAGVGGGALWLSSDGGERFLAERVGSLVEAQLAQGGVTLGSVDVGRDGLVITDLTVDGAEHDGVVRIPRLEADLSWRDLLSRRIHLERLVVEGPAVVVPRRADGALDLPEPVPSDPSQPASTTWLPLGLSLEVDTLVVRDGRLTLPDDGVAADRLHAAGPLTVVGEAIDTELATSWRQQAPALGATSGAVTLGLDRSHGYVTARLDQPGRALSVQGTLAELLTDRSLRIEGGRFAVTAEREALHAVLAAFDPEASVPEGVGAVRVGGVASGPLDHLHVVADAAWLERPTLQPGRGTAVGSADVVIDAGAPLVAGAVDVVDLARLQPVGLPEGVAGAARVQGTVRLGDRVEIDGLFTSPGLEVPGLDAGRARVPVAATVRADGTVDVRADAVLDAVAVGDVRAARVLADTELVVREGAPYGRADLRVPTVRVPVPGRDAARLSLRGDLAADGERVAVALRARDHDDDDLRLAIDASLGLAHQDVVARRVELVAGPETTFRNDAPWRFRIVAGGLSDVSADLVSDHGRLEVEAARLAPGRQEGRARLTQLELGPLRRVAERYVDLPPLEGTVHGHATFSHGDGVRPAMVAELEAREVVFDERLQALSLEVDGRIAEDRLDAELVVHDPDDGHRLATVDIDAPLVDADLYLACERGATLSVDVPEVGWKRLTKISSQVPTLDDQPVTLRTVWGHLEASGDLCDPETHLTGGALARYDDRDLEAQILVEEAPEEDLALRVTGGVRLDDATRALVLGDLHHEPLIDVLTGDAAWGDLLHGWQAEVKSLGLPADLVSEDLEGRLYGALHASGKGLEVAATDGQAQLVEFELGEGDDPREVDLRLRWDTDADQQVNGVLAADVPACDPLRLRGSIDLMALQDPDAPVPFEVTADDAKLPLDALSPLTGGAILEAEGALEVSGTLAGTLDDPRGDLALAMDDASFVLAENGVRYEDIDLDARVEGTDLALDLTAGSRPRYGRFALENARQELEVSGTVALGDGSLRSDLDIAFDELWLLANSTGQARAKGDLQVVGVWPALEVRGDLDLQDARLDLPRQVFLASEEVKVDDTIVFVDGTPERLAGLEDDGEGVAGLLMDAVDVDVDLDLGRRVTLRASVPLAADAGALGAAADVGIDAQLSGDLDVAVQGGEPRASGRVESEGRVDLFTADFDIEQGVISFSGQQITSPNLNFTLSRSGGEYGPVTARVTGTPDDLRIAELTSDDYQDQADVMAILLFGRPLSELDAGEGQTGGQLVQAALVAAAGSQVEDALGTELVDSVRYDSDDGLALGWSIGTDAFLTVAVDPTAETEENLTEARLSWFLGGAGEAEVQTGDAGVSEAWLRVEERF